jgi:hypothetical protein
VGGIGLEPTTSAMSKQCSNQLSYPPEQAHIITRVGGFGKRNQEEIGSPFGEPLDIRQSCSLQHWQPIGCLGYDVSLGDSFQDTRLLFFGEVIQCLDLAAFQGGDLTVQEICHTTLIFIAKCHLSLLLASSAALVSAKIKYKTIIQQLSGLTISNSPG